MRHITKVWNYLAHSSATPLVAAVAFGLVTYMWLKILTGV